MSGLSGNKFVVIYINLDSKISLLCLIEFNQFEHLYLTNEHCFSYLFGGEMEAQSGKMRCPALPTESLPLL